MTGERILHVNYHNFKHNESSYIHLFVYLAFSFGLITLTFNMVTFSIIQTKNKNHIEKLYRLHFDLDISCDKLKNYGSSIFAMKICSFQMRHTFVDVFHLSLFHVAHRFCYSKIKKKKKRKNLLK